MKTNFKKFLIIFILSALLLAGCVETDIGCTKHTDQDANGVCDVCHSSVFVYVDLYSISDLYESSSYSEKLTDYLREEEKQSENFLLLSAGNLWGKDTADTVSQMNELCLTAAVLGDSEIEAGKGSFEKADFPVLAVNLYDSSTDKRWEHCTGSVTVSVGNGINIGIIGAIGGDGVSEDGLYLKTGSQLTELVKKESETLKNNGAQFIIYLLYGGYGTSHTDGIENVTDQQISSYYDPVLSYGYVDLVIEGGTESSYRIKDSQGVYHLQNSNAESFGVTYAEIAFNTAKNDASVRVTRLVPLGDHTPPQQDESDESESIQDDTSLPQQDESEDKPDTEICVKHTDKNSDGVCDVCRCSVLVFLDFYSINDLHGKLADADSHPGVDELTTFLKNARKINNNSFFLSAGDMWQGSSESNLTKGAIITDWMNELNFTAMAIGNHEFDWGEKYIAENASKAEFPFLAINIYDRISGQPVEYCQPSVTVEADGVKIGIIGAIGDCYSSIAADKCEDVFFKVGRQLTSLVKDEATRLRDQGADVIVYVIHDGYGSSNYGNTEDASYSQLSSYYDASLSDGYVDLVFEGHTHQGYILRDEYGVYHLQNRGDNKGGISHAQLAFNTVTEDVTVTEAELISHGDYTGLKDDPIVEELLEKYDDVLSPANQVLGYNKSYRNSYYLCQLMADLYYDLGVELWGDEYDIVLGGGSLSCRSPYELPSGEICYADLQSLFPFDNQLVLCSIRGTYLKSKFFATSNDSYYISYGDYGEHVKYNLDTSATYYVIVDTYTAYYGPNHLTVVEEYDPDIFGRDLLAQHIKDGGLS